MRYAWDFYQDYLEGRSNLVRCYINRHMHHIRLWDRVAADRVDYFIANSINVAGRIYKHYRRESEVIYPPVNTDFFIPGSKMEGDYFLSAGRLVGYKRVDLVVKVCSRKGLKLMVAGDGEEYKRLKSIAGPTVEFLGRVSDDELLKLYQNCRAFIFPGEEDFGIMPLEAQACGKPVIAYGRGGALETVLQGRSGLFFYRQDEESLAQAIDCFIKNENGFDSGIIRKHAEGFGVDRFINEFTNMIDKLYGDFTQRKNRNK
ncbi:glycosyltransferase [Syntrophomonas palmitatica]|uniref:glycosyltransferase n=1 Tax=Syntrophomonas palmitatica TaxID=402877 RepID=UPI000AD5B123|nr:glycosyltransferase [Syntrophomonas palmitatica]